MNTGLEGWVQVRQTSGRATIGGWHAPAKRLLDVLLTAFGVVLLARGMIKLALDFDSFATLENLMRLVLPAALTIAFLPYAYFLRAYIRRGATSLRSAMAEGPSPRIVRAMPLRAPVARQ